MTSRTWRRAGALGVAVLGGVLTVGVAPAAAAPVATIHVPKPIVMDTLALGGNVYALDAEAPGAGQERATLLRIDPSDNTITGRLTLAPGPPTGDQFDTQGMVSAAGAIWIPLYYEDRLVRVNPATMAVATRIPLGRSPVSIVSDGHALWVSLQNDHAVVQIDPSRNSVVRTLRIPPRDSTDGPYQEALAGSTLLVSMPQSGRVARINLRTGRIHFDQVGKTAAMCARILPVRGGYWLDDTECSATYYRWTASRHRITAHVTPSDNDWGATVVRGALYTGEFVCSDTGCTHGRLVKRNVVTGARIAARNVGNEAPLPHFVDGNFWVADVDDSTLQRVAAF